MAGPLPLGSERVRCYVTRAPHQRAMALGIGGGEVSDAHVSVAELVPNLGGLRPYDLPVGAVQLV
jgi:hypothetical protein